MQQDQRVTADPTDRRGAAAITAVTAHERGLLRQVGGDLTGADITACLRVLRRLLDFLGDVDVS